MGYEHYCILCGSHSAAANPEPPRPDCAYCGSALRACPEADHPRIEAALNRERSAHRPALDGVGPLVVLIAVPFLAPVAGLDVRDAIFAVPVIFLALAAAMASGGARRPGEPAAAWRLYALAALTLTVAWVPALRGYAAVAGALALVLGLLAHLRPRLGHGLRRDALVEAVPGLVAVPIVTLLTARLTLGLALALVAFMLAGVLQAGGRRAQDARIGWRLWATTTAVLAAGALMPTRPEVGAALYAVAGWALTTAAVAERSAPTPATPPQPPRSGQVGPIPSAEPAPGA